MKITILGRGNAGCLTALHYAYYTQDNPDIHIELIYDKNILPERVGQATILEPPTLLWNALGIDWYNNPIDATPKTGILYENWGKKNEKIFHPFPFFNVSPHYAPEKLQNIILESKKFDVIESHIADYDEIDSDYIFDCRGRPMLDEAGNWNDYDELKNPLNAGLLGESLERESNINWTRSVATPDGWCFVIPNTINTTSYGYMYNYDITDEEDAVKNFKDLFDMDTVEKFKFKKYLAKNPIIDERVILNGNRLFFLEPLEATAIQTYLWWARYTFDWIILKEYDSVTTTDRIKTYIHQIENFIIWHYQFGSKYDTSFWNYAKTFKIKDPEFFDILEYSTNTDDYYIRDLSVDKNDWQYAGYRPWNFRCWFDGVSS